ncbi:MAG: preprotein translocase subunit YajC [Rickettsiales bacterium]|jgi:preprotein translocase subunit YajC|nr:preprotein translocase subunit YajC [Rickettsiales bacterium]
MDEVISNGNNMGGLVLWVVVLFAFMYFFMIRPNKRRMDDIRNMQDGLKVGDRVITAGGLVGKIKKIDCDRVLVEMAKGVEIEVLKSGISGLDKK